MQHIPESSIIEDMRMYAVSRLYLDNFPHIKAYWPMLGRQQAQLTLSFGVNDMDGTIEKESINSAAGAASANGLALDEFVQLIKNSGFIPVERDSIYNEIKVW